MDVLSLHVFQRCGHFKQWRSVWVQYYTFYWWLVHIRSIPKNTKNIKLWKVGQNTCAQSFGVIKHYLWYWRYIHKWYFKTPKLWAHVFKKMTLKLYISHFDTNLCLFDPKFNPILCFLSWRHKFVQRPPHVIYVVLADLSMTYWLL